MFPNLGRISSHRRHRLGQIRNLMTDNCNLEVARVYHGATKHSFSSVRSGAHFLDWANQPAPFKIYPTLQLLPLPGELRQSGVTVTAHCPGATETGFAKTSGNDKSRLFRQRKPASSAEVAAHGWRAMKAGRPVAVHGALNAIAAFGIRLSPRGEVRAIAASLNRE